MLLGDSEPRLVEEKATKPDAHMVSEASYANIQIQCFFLNSISYFLIFTVFVNVQTFSNYF